MAEAAEGSCCAIYKEILVAGAEDLSLEKAFR